MPRRRISPFRRGLRNSGSSMIRQCGDHRAARVHLVSQRCHQASVFRNVDIHAGPETDEPESLPPREAVTLADVAENTPGDQAGDLHAGDVGAAVGPQPQGIALVLRRGLVECRVDEAPGMVPALLHPGIHRRAVGMHVEDVHEYADLDRVTVEVGVACPLDRDHAPVGGRDHGTRARRDGSGGIAKELQHEQHRKPERRRPPSGKPGDDCGGYSRGGEKGPALPGDERMGVTRAQSRPPLGPACWQRATGGVRDQFLLVSTSLFFLIQGIMALSFSPTISIGCSAVIRRRESKVGAPARLSRMNSFAYSPDWMRARAARIAFLVSAVMTFGPVTYSPNSALFEIE